MKPTKPSGVAIVRFLSLVPLRRKRDILCGRPCDRPVKL